MSSFYNFIHDQLFIVLIIFTPYWTIALQGFCNQAEQFVLFLHSAASVFRTAIADTFDLVNALLLVHL